MGKAIASQECARWDGMHLTVNRKSNRMSGDLGFYDELVHRGHSSSFTWAQNMIQDW